MPGGRAGGGGHSSGGGRIGGGGGGGMRSGGGRPSGGFSSGGRPAGSRPPGGSGSNGSFWTGMLVGSMMSNNRRRTTYQPGGYNRPPQNSNRPARGGAGCATVITVLLIGIVILFAFAMAFGSRTASGSSGSVAKSTVDRTKLDSKYVTKTAYYEDTAGFIGSSSTLQSGMKAFYQETGVQPFLYVTRTVNGSSDPSSSELEAFCASLYDELFEDEGHLLVVSYDYDGYWYYVGFNAATVFDDEAEEIFQDYINAYANELNSGGMDLDSFYSHVFADTAERIMQVTPNYTVYYVIGLIVLAILVLLFFWWRKAKEQKNKEAQHAETILNTDINDLANDPTLSDLEGKYDGKASSASGQSSTTRSAKSQSAGKGWTTYSSKVDTYESAREAELKSPTLQDLEDKYK